MRIDLVNIFQMSASPLKSCRYTNLIVNWHEEGLNYAIRTLCSSNYFYVLNFDCWGCYTVSCVLPISASVLFFESTHVQFDLFHSAWAE
jgi:hypothetical protein